jgi:hypothetical protein
VLDGRHHPFRCRHRFDHLSRSFPKIDAIPLQGANLSENFDGLAGVGSLNLHHLDDHPALCCELLWHD